MESYSRRRAALGMGLAAIAGNAWAKVPQQRRHALLIGAGTVAALDSRLWLDGPANDVQLLRSSLQAAGWPASAIWVLSSAPGYPAPTCLAVHQSMDRLLATAREGDQVLVHFSGHGAQVPAQRNRREADGLDEVMLLADVARWQGTASQGRLPNALRDEELAVWLAQLSTKGVNTWTSLDCCHAAGLLRHAAGRLEGDTLRSVTPADLGVPLPTWQEAQRGAVLQGDTASASERGKRGPLNLPPPLPLQRRVFACAAAAQASAVECRLPDPQDGSARTFGLFTHALSALIRAQAFDSASTLASALLRQPTIVQRQGPWPVIVGDSMLRWSPSPPGGSGG